MATVWRCHLQILLFDFVDFRKISLRSFCENQSYCKLRVGRASNKKACLNNTYIIANRKRAQ